MIDIKTLIYALKKGASVENPTGLKYTGLLVTLALLGLSVAQSYGLFSEISGEVLIDLVLAAILLYAQVASTDKIGFGPDSYQQPGGLRDKKLQTGADKQTKPSESSKFPSGPFFDS